MGISDVQALTRFAVAKRDRKETMPGQTQMGEIVWQVETPVREWDVTVEKEEGKMLGIDVETRESDLRITKLKDDGILAAVSQTLPEEKQITSGCEIVSVNDVHGSGTQLLKEIESAQSLRFGLRVTTGMSWEENELAKCEDSNYATIDWADGALADHFSAQGRWALLHRSRTLADIASSGRAPSQARAFRWEPSIKLGVQGAAPFLFPFCVA